VYVYATTLSGYSLLIVRTSIKYAIANYFDSLDISDGFQVPVIQTVSANAPTGNVYYQYQIVATDSNGNKSIPSAPYSITNGAAIANNTITWTRNTTMNNSTISSTGPVALNLARLSRNPLDSSRG
jgi:hypothetical protein